MLNFQLQIFNFEFISFQQVFPGSNAGPAQWPNYSQFPRAARTNDSKTNRWTLILKAFKNIRSKVLNNATIMRGTQIQLVELNQTTLS